MPVSFTVVERRLAEANVAPTGEQIARLVEYANLLERWNAKMNLTALESADIALDRLIVEPVVASREIDVDDGVLVDVGSGGGSPAIPLKIMCPGLRLTMIEVKSRKSVFLREALRHVGLEGADVRTGRFEDVLRSPDLRGLVDVMSIRAVRADTADLDLFAGALRVRGQLLWFLSKAQETPVLPGMLRLERLVPLVAALDSHVADLRRHE